MLGGCGFSYKHEDENHSLVSQVFQWNHMTFLLQDLHNGRISPRTYSLNRGNSHEYNVRDVLRRGTRERFSGGKNHQQKPATLLHSSGGGTLSASTLESPSLQQLTALQANVRPLASMYTRMDRDPKKLTALSSLMLTRTKKRTNLS